MDKCVDELILHTFKYSLDIMLNRVPQVFQWSLDRLPEGKRNWESDGKRENRRKQTRGILSLRGKEERKRLGIKRKGIMVKREIETQTQRYFRKGKIWKKTEREREREEGWEGQDREAELMRAEKGTIGPERDRELGL